MPIRLWAFVVTCLSFAGMAFELPGAGLKFPETGTPRIWGTVDGLPQSSVIALTQTRDGYLWLGTLNGLVRFDGIEFTVFDEDTAPGLSSGRVVSLFEDSQEGLWIGTESAGIVRLKDGRFSSTGIGGNGAEGRMVAACEDVTGAVWICTADGQLWRWRDGITNVFAFGASRFSLDPIGTSRAVIADKSGLIWVGTNGGLAAIRPQPTFTAGEMPHVERVAEARRLDFLLASASGGFWVLGAGRVQKRTSEGKIDDLGPYRWSLPVATACEDREGNLIVGTRGAGLFQFDATGKVTTLSAADGLSDSTILSLVVDREGSLWVGTDGGGLNRFKKPLFNVVRESFGSVVQSVTEDGEGTLLIGYNAGQIDRWQGKLLERFGQNANLAVKAVFADREGQIWAGVYGAGLYQWQTNLFVQVGTNIVPANVLVIHQDRAGRLWIGTQNGLVRYQKGEWKVYTHTNGLSADGIRAIADDADGNLWIGTADGGLNQFHNEQFTAFHKKHGMPSENVSSLYADAEGVLWIGTDGGGLARLHRGKWFRYTKREGLISNSIGYLIEDAQGYLWIGSNAGLMRERKSTLNDVALGTARSLSVRVYREDDGLPTRECTMGQGAFRTRDGRLWFPTIKGLAYVDPSQLRHNTNPPPVIIESVLVDTQAQDINRFHRNSQEILTIPARTESLEIHYTSLNLAAPERARFKYRLEGHETAWTDAGNFRLAHYSSLLPGHYRFQVKACNEDGLWNEIGSALAVVVLPPFWRTWWFITLSSLILLGAIVGMVHYLSTQKLHRQVAQFKQQEAVEKERGRIARDIHDQLGASLTQVSLLGELVESDKNSPDDVEAHARQISQTARETTRALDEIVWTVNPSNDTLEGLVNYVCKYAQDYLAIAGVRYRLDVPAQLPATTLPPEVRHNVFLAAKESVTNVVRHAQAASVWIRLHLEPGRFKLEIEDDGRGPGDIASRAHRNGLRNMRKRMEDVGGEFSIEPGPERGTVVRLTAPLAKA